MAKSMKCPICDVDLVMSERQGVEIDYCPQCRGVWLDRGELDKIIERAAGQTAAPVSASPLAQAPHQSTPQQYSQPQYRDDGYYVDKHGYKKRKKNILGEIFDF